MVITSAKMLFYTKIIDQIKPIICYRATKGDESDCKNRTQEKVK